MRKSLVIVTLVGCMALAVGHASAQTPPDQATKDASIAALIASHPAPCLLQSLRFLSSATAPTLMNRLKLTDDQNGRVTELLRKADEAVKPKIAAQREAAKEFVLALAKSETDQATLLAAAEKANSAESAIMTERLKTFCEIRALLTEEQKTELTKFVEQQTRPWRGEQSRIVPQIVAPPAPAAQDKAPTDTK